jgi:hypothetical protein
MPRLHRHSVAALVVLGLLALAPPARAADDALGFVVERKDGNSACFRRDYDAAHLRAHPGQKTQSIVLSLKYEGGTVEGFAGRVMMRHAGSQDAFYIYAGCDWSAHKQPGQAAASLLGAARNPHGLDCIAIESGSSAREAGSIVVDFASDGRKAVAVFDTPIAAWRGMDQRDPAPDLELGRADRVFVLSRTDGAACKAMEDNLKY